MAVFVFHHSRDCVTLTLQRRLSGWLSTQAVVHGRVLTTRPFTSGQKSSSRVTGEQTKDSRDLGMLLSWRRLPPE
ncbi:uncharacterized [Tachysurus ichikawai]